MARPIKRLETEPAVTEELRRRLRSRTCLVRERERAEIILLRLEGIGVAEIAARLKTTAKRVSTWSKRFETRGLAGLEEAAGRGRKPSLPVKKIASVVAEVTRPPKGRKRWSVRSMARHAGVSPSSVQRIWSKNDLKPHVVETFKLSNDPRFEEKFWDVIGLYLDPPERALVLCCDEKSQCQALERSQPGLPLGPRHPRTMTHDYKRQRCSRRSTLLNGAVLAACKPRHRHQEFLSFLREIDKAVPTELDIHCITDRPRTHSHPRIKAWLATRSRWHMHFIPTYSSWLNQVERFFAMITDKAIRRGSFTSVKQLVQRIDHFVAAHNTDLPALQVDCHRRFDP